MNENIRSTVKRIINKFRLIPKSCRKLNDSKHPRINTERAGISEGVILQDQSTNRSGEIYVGKSWIGRYCELTVGEKGKISIGDHVTINPFSHILGDVTIENFCAIAPRCFMSSGGHSFRDNPSDLIRNQDLDRLQGNRLNAPITVEEDAWIGAGAFIQAGTTIGRGSVVGAGSVVLRDTAPYEIVAGVPAKKIGERLRFIPRNKLDASRLEDRPYFYRGFLHHKNDFRRSYLLAGIKSSVIIAGGGSKLEIDFEYQNAKAPIRLSFSSNGKSFAQKILSRSERIILDLPKSTICNRWGNDKEITIYAHDSDANCEGGVFGVRSINTY